ncbi:MAPEG family protein [Bauldia sp.]|uniref:MAPEG family protein n=1 Tax=Bauldia sp. TaxID=2575872 RepID=UPI003BAD05FE
MSNRDQVPAPSPVAARTDRVATNMLENLVLFIAVIVAVGLAGRESPQTQLGAAIFFWARLVYWPVYVIGIPYLRTLLWLAAMIGIGMVAAALL